MSDAATPSPCPVVRARSILQKVRAHGDEWFGIDYNSATRSRWIYC